MADERDQDRQQAPRQDDAARGAADPFEEVKASVRGQQNGARADAAQGVQAANGAHGRKQGDAKSGRRSKRDHESQKRSKKKGGSFSLGGSVQAFRDVRAAKKAHASAADAAKELKTTLDRDVQTYQHRAQIEQDYHQIVSEQTEAVQKNAAARDAATRKLEALKQERAELAQALADLKAKDEESLRPYRDLSDTTKERYDSLAKALADAKRSVKTAQNQVSDATREREQSISNANNEVDRALANMRRAQDAVDNAQKTPGTPAATLTKVRSEFAAEKAHLDSAREKVTTVTTERQAAVDAAQEHLWQAQAAAADAQAKADSAKQEADSARGDYERLYKKAQTDEKAAQDAVSQKDGELKACKDAISQAEARRSEAQGLLDEANQVHATPEKTAALASRIDAERAELAGRRKQVESLAHEAKNLSSRTRAARVLFVLILIAAAIAVVVLLIWFFFLRSR